MDRVVSAGRWNAGQRTFPVGCRFAHRDGHHRAGRHRRRCRRQQALRYALPQLDALHHRDFEYLSDRIAEAEREDWLGEIEGLQVTRAGAEEKLAHLDAEQARRKTVDLGIPTFNQLAARIMEGNDSVE